MEALKALFSHLASRLAVIKSAQAEGRKVIGYTPGGFFPEELVLAAGAIPICLVHGGDHSAVEHSAKYICRWMDPFCRAQIGYAVSGNDPYYNILDLLVVPITDNHIRAVSDVLDYNTSLKIFTFGVPHMKEPSTWAYYLHGLKRLKGKIEEITGTEVTEPKLREAVVLCNKERQLLRKISLLRKSGPIPISSRDFIALNHGSFIADKAFMVDLLASIYAELREGNSGDPEGPRILFTGSTLAIGDSRIVDQIETAGGTIVMEEFAEGIRPYWENVSLDGDLMESLADCYLMKRICPAWFRPGHERHNFLIKLCGDYQVDGVIWYQLMFRESYKTESYYFPGRLKKKTGLSMLEVESDYDPAEGGNMRTRIETYVDKLTRTMG